MQSDRYSQRNERESTFRIAQIKQATTRKENFYFPFIFFTHSDILLNKLKKNLKLDCFCSPNKYQKEKKTVPLHSHIHTYKHASEWRETLVRKERDRESERERERAETSGQREAKQRETKEDGDESARSVSVEL